MALDLKYGKWTVLEANFCQDKRGMYKHKCRCECGHIAAVYKSSLVRSLTGQTKGCIRCGHKKELQHCATKHPLYSTYVGMLKRCYSPTHHKYKYYGARGITVDSTWKDDFFVFVRDLGERPSKHHTLDRIDSTKGYTPNNVRWANYHTQNNNKRDTIRITFGGIEKTQADWGRFLGIPYHKIANATKKGDEIKLIREILFKRGSEFLNSNETS